ncbi:creatininase family protein [Muricoccus radiodurans]|uniref:creatininase family protein n=1 Tax=Muricoccus radiodurans TaxID=2231721 RepID=UPI003CED2550
MRIADMDWRAVEDWLAHDDRCVLPLGSTEQHAGLSLSVDSILSERVAAEAAEPLGVPVFPVLAYGITPLFTAYPGTVSLRASTYLAILTDVLDGLYAQGFRRVLICNGHGGNGPGAPAALEFMAQRPDARIRWHDWWKAPKIFAAVQATDPVASHASWMENFPWTRRPNAPPPPAGAKPMTDTDRLRTLSPVSVRAQLGDGNFGGLYQRPDEDMLRIWDVAVAETRALLEGGWD